MTTSPPATLSEPKGTGKVPLGTLAYFRARLKHRIYSVLIKEFKKSGLTQADLARRLDMEPAQLSRLLSGPGNLTLETVSDLLFATSGAELGLSTAYPLATRSHGFLGNQASQTPRSANVDLQTKSQALQTKSQALKLIEDRLLYAAAA